VLQRKLNTRQLMAERKLTTTEKLFYIYLVQDICNDTGICHIPITELHKRTLIAGSSLSTSIRKLIETGYIRGTLTPNRSGHDAWLIHLTEYGLLREGEREPTKPALILPEPASIDAGPVRITITVEPRDI